MPQGEVRSLRDWLDDTADDCKRHLFGRAAHESAVTRRAFIGPWRRRLSG